MDSIKICGVALLCAAAIVIIKQFRNEFALPLKLSAGVLLFAYALSVLAPSVLLFTELIASSPLSQYAPYLIKALAIAMLTQLTAELCRDCGEGSIASNIELIGRAEILLLCLPALTDLIKLAEGMIS